MKPLARREGRRLHESARRTAVRAVPGRLRRRRRQGRGLQGWRRHAPLAAVPRRRRHRLPERQPQQAQSRARSQDRRAGRRSRAASCATADVVRRELRPRRGRATGHRLRDAAAGQPAPRLLQHLRLRTPRADERRQGLRRHPAGLQRHDVDHRRARTARRRAARSRRSTRRRAFTRSAASSPRCSQRERTGEGALVETSLFDTAMGFLAYFFQSYWERGAQPAKSRLGPRVAVPVPGVPGRPTSTFCSASPTMRCGASSATLAGPRPLSPTIRAFAPTPTACAIATDDRRARAVGDGRRARATTGCGFSATPAFPRRRSTPSPT